MFGMSATTAAIVGAGAATIGGALINSNAASDAADSQAQSNDKAQAENSRQFDVTQANQAPYLAAGKDALGQLQAGIGADRPTFNFDANGVQMDPGYQFGMKQGEQALDRKVAAGGGRVSGAALKSAAQYGTDYATTGYSSAYNRAYGTATDTYNRDNQARSERLNRLAALAGIGQTSTQNIGALGAQNSGANSALMVAAGNNAGAAQLAQGNIWGNAGNQIAALYGRNSDSSGFGVTEGATNQTDNFNNYGTGYSP